MLINTDELWKIPYMGESWRDLSNTCTYTVHRYLTQGKHMWNYHQNGLSSACKWANMNMHANITCFRLHSSWVWKVFGKCFIVLASSKRMGQFEVYMHFFFWTTKEQNIRLVELHKLQLQALQQSDTHIHELYIGFWASRLVQDLYGNGNLHSLALRYPDALKSQKNKNKKDIS